MKINFYKIKSILKLFCIFFVFICIIFFSIEYTFFSKNKIATRGTEQKLEKVELNFENFANNSYQNYLEQKIKNSDLFAKKIIQMGDFFNFKLFNHTNTNIVVGRGGGLFGDNYISEKLCIKDYKIDRQTVKKAVERIQKVQDILETKNIKFVYILAPNKADFYAEYLPNKYKNNCNNNRKYDVFVDEIKKSNINFIDANEYFLNLKNRNIFNENSGEKLFPKYGIHWSNFGFAYFIQNNLIPYLEKLFNKRFNEIDYSYTISKKPLGSDYDLGSLIGLQNKDLKDKLLYPKLKENKHNGYKPKTLIIGDSFADILSSNLNLYDYFNFDLNNVTWGYYVNNVFYNEDNYLQIKPLKLNPKERIAYIKNKELIIFIHITPNILSETEYKFFDDVINNF